MKLRENHPAILEKRTVHIKARRSEDNPLKTVDGNSKLGNGKKIVQKGKWKGQPMYSLTLEERATCPPCEHYLDCYANMLMWAKRQTIEGLELRLYSQLVDIAKKYPNGFVIRLHIAGDFYSVDYVKFWEQCLIDFPQMTIFGYSARIGKDNDEGIYEELKRLIYKYQERFLIRFSTNKTGRGKLMYAANEKFKGKNFFQCPEQIDKVDSCIDCMACLSTRKTVRFLTH